MTGKEVRCLHLMFCFSYNRHVNLDAHDKTALVSLSLTDEPIVVDVVRHSSRDKVGCNLVELFVTLQHFQHAESLEHFY